MIRRTPSPTRRRRSWLAVAVLLTVGGVVLFHRVADPARRRASMLPPTTTAQPAPPISKVFLALGGPVVAVVTIADGKHVRTDLLDSGGATLAQGWTGPHPLTLRAEVARNATVSLVLYPRGLISWQAEVSGARI